jgi:hypothetical protein
VAGNASPACFVTGLAVPPPMAQDPALEACLLQVTGQVTASTRVEPVGNALPAGNEHEPAAHEHAATDGIADDVVMLMGANDGQAEQPGLIRVQTMPSHRSSHICPQVKGPQAWIARPFTKRQLCLQNYACVNSPVAPLLPCSPRPILP